LMWLSRQASEQMHMTLCAMVCTCQGTMLAVASYPQSQ